MSLEEIKAEIKRMIDLMTKQRDVDVVVALYWVLAMLDKLEPSWHIEAEESPRKEGTYQVIVRNKDEVVTTGYWKGDCWLLPMKYASHKVVAWKEKDKPCKKEGK